MNLKVSIPNVIQTMPKVDLHTHLEGSVAPSTLRQLAVKRNRLADFEQLSFTTNSFIFEGFYQFRQQFRFITELLQTEGDFELVAYECGKEMKRQNIMYQEMYVSVLLHTHFANNKIDIQSLLQGLEKGRLRAKEDFNVELRWIFGIPRRRCFTKGRRYQPEIAEKALSYALLGRSAGVIGIGLGGDESDAPTKPFESTFAKAKDKGLLSIPHAGETADANNVREAIIYLKADRIGHGIRAVEDQEVVELLAVSQTPLDISLTSNVCLGIVPDYESHPISALIKAGVRVTLSSDDPTLFGSDLCNEYQHFYNHYCAGRPQVFIDLARNALELCAAEAHLKAEFSAKLKDWLTVFPLSSAI